MLARKKTGGKTMRSHQNHKNLTVGVLVFAMLFLGCYQAGEAWGAEEVVVCIWGGEFTKTQRMAYYDPFEKDTGIKVKTVSYPNFAKMKAMVMTGNIEWDVVTAEAKWVIRGLQEGLFEPLDFDIIDTKDFFPKAVHPSGYAVLSESYTHAICYNTNKFSEQRHPKTWQEFWDVEKFPGPRSLYNNPVMNLEQALLADGVSPDQLYPLDVDRAFASLDRIKPHVLVWFKSITQSAQLMSSQEVDLIGGTPPRMFFIRNQGAPVGVEFNQAMADKSYWVVLKGTKHKKAAMKLINYITRPKPLAAWVNIWPLGVANKRAYDFVKADILPVVPTSPENAEKIIWIDSEWWAQNEAQMLERWNNWIMNQ